jgi:hypothetical protein
MPVIKLLAKGTAGHGMAKFRNVASIYGKFI